MIKFFRHIRQRLVSDLLDGKVGNKFSKYLLYALGEILLVVIGILIALQINNWNEGRKEQIQEQVLLEQLHKEFNSNLAQIDEKIGIRDNINIATSKLFEYIDNSELRQNDSIMMYMGILGLAATFDPIQNDLISSGKLQLISDQRLKELLTLWTTEVVQLTEEEVNYYEFRNNLYRPFIHEHFLTRTLHHGMWKDSSLQSFLLDKSKVMLTPSTPSNHDLDLSPVLDNPHFENIVSQANTLAIVCNLQSYTLRERIEEIIELLEKEQKR